MNISELYTLLSVVRTGVKTNVFLITPYEFLNTSKNSYSQRTFRISKLVPPQTRTWREILDFWAIMNNSISSGKRSASG